MGKPDPIALRERTAAAMMDMEPREFRRLVDGGHLPRPKSIGGIERWDAAQLRLIMSGEAIAQEFET